MKPSEQIYYFHLRLAKGDKILPCGGVTCAFTYDEELHTIFWSMAICTPKDNFEKRLGRVKAGGRLNSYKWLKAFNVDPDIKVNEVIGEIKTRVLEDDKVNTVFTEAMYNGNYLI